MNDSMVTKKIWLAGVFFCLLGIPFSGYTADEKPAGDDEVIMEEVVVTGTRTQEEVSKVPANVTVINEEDIRNSNARNVTDLLRTEEGLSVRDYYGNGKTVNVDLRGFGETGPSNTLVLVDGRRVNSVDLSDVDWTQIPLEQIERVEIVRGTGTVLYGDNAVGGVINIITKIPSKKPVLKAEAGYGSYGQHKEAVSLSGGRENVSGSLYASYDATEGYRENSKFRARDVGGKIVLDPSDILSLNLSGSYHSDIFGLPGYLTKAEVDQDRRASNSPLDNAKTRDRYVNLGISLDLGDFGSIMSDISLRNRESESDWVSWMWQSETETRTWAFTPRYSWEGDISGHKNTLIAGGDFYWTDLDILTSDEGINKNSQGFYFNNAFSLLDTLTLSVGARRERVAYEFKTNTMEFQPIERQNAYSAGLTYAYRGKSSLFARFNKSFRFPLTDELFSSWTGLNTRLEPQTGKHYEAGVRHYLTKKMYLAVTLYRAEFDNEIFYNPLTLTNENHPKTLHRGIEIGAKAELSRFVTCFGNLTYEKATFEKEPFDGKDIPAVPRHKGSLGMRIHDLLPGLVFSAQYNYVGSSYAISDQANSLEKLGQYFTIDSKVSYQWRTLEAFLGVNNLTNEKYSQYAVASGSGPVFYPSPERNWTAGLKVRF